MGGVIDLDCFFMMEARKIVWSAGDALGRLLVLPCPVFKVNGKLQQSNPGRVTKDPRPFRNEGIGHSSRKGAKTC